MPSCWEECRRFLIFTVDAQGTCNLDDAPLASGAWAPRTRWPCTSSTEPAVCPGMGH